MKNKKVMKLISFIVILLTIVMAVSNVFAVGINMDPNSVQAKSSNLATSTGNIMEQALGVIQVVAITLAIIMMIILAIKYFSAAPQEKADIKKSLSIYVIGAVLLFGASGILQIIRTFATQNIK